MMSVLAHPSQFLESPVHDTMALTLAPPRWRRYPCRMDHSTRADHLAWSKGRALEHVDAGDLRQAVASMGSDLKSHPQTDNPALNGLVMIGLMYAGDGDRAAVRRWIERFQ
jgi:hypothetical protein